jgi:hypothetical protein
MPKMKQYASYAEWKRDQSARNKRLIGVLERLISETAPQLTRTVKWGQGCFADEESHRVYIHAEDDQVQLGFYLGATFDDPAGLLAGSGKYVRHVNVRSASDLDPESFAALIRQAIT